jgi:hypothetical protein
MENIRPAHHRFQVNIVAIFLSGTGVPYRPAMMIKRNNSTITSFRINKSHGVVRKKRVTLPMTGRLERLSVEKLFCPGGFTISAQTPISAIMPRIVNTHISGKPGWVIVIRFLPV